MTHKINYRLIDKSIKNIRGLNCKIITALVKMDYMLVALDETKHLIEDTLGVLRSTDNVK